MLIGNTYTINYYKLLFINFHNLIFSEICNIDQTSINYEMQSLRTLSYQGERCTALQAKVINDMTHSYTLMPVFCSDGIFYPKILICLQETNNKFGPIVTKNLLPRENIELVCSTSGKLHKPHIKSWY